MLSGTALPKRALVAICSLGLLASCVHKKYDTPITKNTQQPDKVLFDQAMHDIEHGRYDNARQNACEAIAAIAQHSQVSPTVEPYLVELLPAVLSAVGDKMAPVKVAASSAAL